MNDLKPFSNPTWVLKACEEAFASKDSKPALLDAFEKILAAESVSSVWRAIEKRQASPDRPGWHWEMSALRLVEVCGEGIADFAGSQRLSQSERIAIATKVGSTCKDLIGLLDVWGLPESECLPDEFEKLGFAIRGICSDAHVQGNGTVEEKEKYRVGVEEGAYIVVHRLGEILSALSEDAMSWASMQPVVARPNKKNAARTYFIRHLTAYFVEEYGSPLRQQTLILTGAFFDVTDLDVSTISKLAPSRD
jgi:hypothetical protein